MPSADMSLTPSDFYIPSEPTFLSSEVLSQAYLPQSHEATWLLKNNGNVPWPVGTRFVFISGNNPSTLDAVPVQPILPDETTLVQMTLRNPSSPSLSTTNETRFQLVTPSSEPFGSIASLIIPPFHSSQNPNPKLERALLQLREMGFTDVPRNSALLTKYKYDIAPVLQELLS